MRFLGHRRWLFAAVLGAALAAPITAAQAQTGKLTGIVTDAESGKPVEGVAVVIQGTTLGANTNAAGRYFIIQVPPGTYTVQARRLGFQSVNATNVQIAIDVTREQNFKIKASNQTLQAVTVQAAQAPLVERGQVGSRTTITAEQITSLPVTSIAGVLALQQGFTEVPQNTSVVSLAEEQRSTTPAVRVRGSRGGATLSMIDGIPINNPLFPGDAVSLSAFAVQQVDFQRGGMDPQYGNALAGVITQAIREGGSMVSGSVDFQNSTLPGSLFNSTADRLNALNLLRGYLSGPVPGTSGKLRYSIAGQVQSSANRVLEFDRDVYTANAPVTLADELNVSTKDYVPGWQAFGGTQNSSVAAKLTFLPFDNTTIKFTALGSERQNRGYDRRFFFAYRGDPLNLVNNRADSLFILTGGDNRQSRDLIQPSVRDAGNVFVGSIEQRFGRNNLTVRLAQTDFERTTCAVFLGTCIPGPFAYGNFDQSFLSVCGTFTGCDRVPYSGIASGVYGGERFTTRTVRADLQSQITDHNNLQAGVQFVNHDFTYSDVQQDATTTSGLKNNVYQVYRGQPIEAAAYVQSVIEYDFVTIKLGGRFDYGRARGQALTNPFDPTNGTTAREVCNGSSVGGKSLLNAQGQPYGLAGCAASPIDPATQRARLLDTATAIAQLDDFSQAPARTSFSPRVGIAFPLTESSQVFFNAGRYTMIPLYGNTYRNTGIGTVAGNADKYCAANQVKPGTTECVPNMAPDNPQFVGNPRLRLEESRQFEVGYAGELSRTYAITVAVFNRAETGLTGIRASRATQDIGSTYVGALPVYNIVVNGDFLSSRGAEVQFRRRLANRWSYDVNYGIARSTTNARPPERANEVSRTDEALRAQNVETLTDIDQTHRFNVNLQYRVGNDIPSLPFGIGRALRNASGTITYQFSSGLPYTPLRGAAVGIIGTNNQGDVNSARQPSVQDIGLLLDKAFRIRNMRYSGFLRVSNLLDRLNCSQVFPNTGTCDGGLRDFANRRIGNSGDNTSTAFDQPEFIGPRRSIATGITVSF